MVARVLVPVLPCGGNAITPPPPGDHQRTLLANATKRAIRQGDRKGSPIRTNLRIVEFLKEGGRGKRRLDLR
jgi:hypothetical protein